VLRRLIRGGLRRLGYELRRVPGPEPISAADTRPPIAPIWPLPRVDGGPDDDDLRAAFAAHALWHYAFEFEGGPSFPASHNEPGPDTDDPARPLQRFRHLMPELVAASGGSLRGKRVLDIACSSGFWSIQCALMGADVVGFDARPEQIAQAELVKRVTGATSASFTVLDFWDMQPETLGTFDIVLNLGILYHLSDPLRALEMTVAMAREHVLLDTSVLRAEDELIALGWETPYDVRAAAHEGVIGHPSPSAVELLLRHIGVRGCTRIPLRTTDLPPVYLRGGRASWLIEV
jgi:SAM-dependent methyltransferase